MFILILDEKPYTCRKMWAELYSIFRISVSHMRTVTFWEIVSASITLKYHVEILSHWRESSIAYALGVDTTASIQPPIIWIFIVQSSIVLQDIALSSYHTTSADLMWLASYPEHNPIHCIPWWLPYEYSRLLDVIWISDGHVSLAVINKFSNAALHMRSSTYAVVSTPKHKYRASLQCERIGMILQGVLAEVFSECTVRIWLTRFEDWVKLRPHFLQVYGFSPVWV